MKTLKITTFWHFWSKLGQNVRVSHKHLSGEGSTVWPIRMSTWCRRWGRHQQPVWGVVYVSSCQHTNIYNSLAYSDPPIPHLTWKEGGNPQLNPNTKTCMKWLLRHILKGKLCCVDCIRTITQCMSLHAADQGFLNSIEGWWGNSLAAGDGKFCWEGNSIYMVTGTWGEVILTIQTFFKTKNKIL